MKIYDIINELNLENGSNYKKGILQKYKDHELLKRVLKLTYDKTIYTFGITMKNIDAPDVHNDSISLEQALDVLENDFCTRKTTGNDALDSLYILLMDLSKEDAQVLEKIINRDLRINIGRTIINEVYKGLIVKPCYMRCDIYTPKTAKNISFPAYVQLKADGTYRETSNIGEIQTISRSGKVYNYPFTEDFKKVQPGYFHGEMTVKLDDDLLQSILPKLQKIDKKNDTNNVQEIIEAFEISKTNGIEYILPRSIGNGLLNSDEVPYQNIIYDLWDYVTEEDYQIAALKDRKKIAKIPYSERLETLKILVQEIDNPNIRVIETKEVQNIQEALQFTAEKMQAGLEGAILKDKDLRYENKTSKKQLKLKVQFNLDVRIIGFKEGTKGTKREQTFGSIIYATDDNLIRGSVSGFNDTDLEDFNSRREELIGTIMEIQGNDLTKSRVNDYYAVSHPRYITLRDKNTTDDLQRAFKMVESAKCISK